MAYDTSIPGDRAAIAAGLAAAGMAQRSDFTLPDGKAYAIVAGVIRNSGSGWALILNSGHSSLNIDSISQDSLGITVNYSGVAASKAISFVATPDETLASAKFFAGASVMPGSAYIQITRDGDAITDIVSYNGSTWSISGGRYTFGSYTSGDLTLNHSFTADSSFGAVNARSDTYSADFSTASGAIATNATKISFYDRATGAKATVADTAMQAVVTRTRKTLATVDPSTVNETTFPGGNIWLWGIMEK